MAPLACAWNNGPNGFYFGSAPTDGLEFEPWTMLTAPYIKTSNILDDPLAPGQPSAPGFSADAINLSQPLFGLNFMGLSPFEPNPSTGAGVTLPNSMTSFPSSSNFVMLASKWSMATVLNTPFWTGGNGSSLALWGNGIFVGNPNLVPFADNGPIVNTIVQAPDCYDSPSVCNDWPQWGEEINSPNDQMYTQFPTGNQGLVEGVDTGGVSRRRPNLLMTLVFADGHSKAMSAGQAASGLTFSDSITPDSLVGTYAAGPNPVADVTKYMWENLPQ